MHVVLIYGDDGHRDLHSFPTRRSSDLRDQRSGVEALGVVFGGSGNGEQIAANKVEGVRAALVWNESTADRKSTRLNSSHVEISYAVFCLKKKNHEVSCDSHAPSSRR